MAGDWIPMRIDLAEDPAVISMAEELSVHETHVVGMLHKAWSWANKHTTDGHARSVTGNWLDTYIGVTGFSRAMENANWLDAKNGLTFPDFDNYNSNGAKQRLLTTKRKKAQRERDKGVTQPSRPERDQRREENRTEKKDLNPLGRPPVDPPVDYFGTACALYPKRDGNDPEATARKAWLARIKEGVSEQALTDGVKRYALWCTAKGKVGTELVMRRSTFFGKDRPFEQPFTIEPRPAPAVTFNESWWKSNDGISAKGKELNVTRPPVSQMAAGWFLTYKLKVFAAAGNGPWLDLLPERLRNQIEAERGAAG
jgi:hypothetical protein